MQKDVILMKKLLALLLCGALAASAAAPVFAAESVTCRTAVAKEEAIPDSALYYGRVKAIDRSEDGTVTRLLMESDRHGEYVFSVSADTVWVDDGGRSADDSGDLEVGEGLYIFHSLAETRSLPPQSAAFAIVRNTPMDVGCAMYYGVEAVSEENGRTRIQTNNGSLFITANENTEFSLYGSDEEVSAADLLPGSHIIAWNGVNAASFPAQTNALHIMLLPAASWETLTRTAAAELVYRAAGSPRVSASRLRYEDVAEDSSCADAVSWARRKNLLPWADGETFGTGETVTLEELVTILWRWQGSPRGAGAYSGEEDVSAFARSAVSWACREGLISGDSIRPQRTVTVGEAQKMIAELTAAD